MKEDLQMTEGLKTMETSDNDIVKIAEKTSDPVLKQVIKNDSELNAVIEVEACVDELLETAHKNVDIKLEHVDSVKVETEVSKELSQSHIALENGGFEEPCVKLEKSQDPISLNDTDLNEIDSLACIKQEVLDGIENGEVSSIVCDGIMRAIDQNFEEIDKILLGNSCNLNDLNVGKVDMVELENTSPGKSDPQKIVLSDVLSAVNQFEKTHASDIKTEEIGLSEPEMEHYGSDSDNESVDIELDIDEWDFPAELRHQSLLNKFGIYDCYIALEDINVIRAKTPEKQVAIGKKIKAKCMKNDKKSITKNAQNLKEIQQCGILEPVTPKAMNVRAMRSKTNQQTYIKRKQTKHLKQLKNLRSDRQKCTRNINVRSKIKMDHKNKNDTEAHNYRQLKGGKNNKMQRDSTFKCHICSTQYGNLKSLQSHKKIHWDMEFICKFCGPICTYMTKAALENHLMLHGKTDYECSICNKIFPNERKLKLHVSNTGLSLTNVTNAQGHTRLDVLWRIINEHIQMSALSNVRSVKCCLLPQASCIAIPCPMHSASTHAEFVENFIKEKNTVRNTWNCFILTHALLSVHSVIKHINTKPAFVFIDDHTQGNVKHVIFARNHFVILEILRNITVFIQTKRNINVMNVG